MGKIVRIINGEYHVFYINTIPDQAKLQLLDGAIQRCPELETLINPAYIAVDQLRAEDMQVGGKFLIDRSSIMSSGCKYVVAECTHIYAGVIFYRYENDGFEDYCPANAAMWSLRGRVLALHYHTNESYSDNHGILTANQLADPLIKFHYESTYESYIKSLNNESI